MIDELRRIAEALERGNDIAARQADAAAELVGIMRSQTAAYGRAAAKASEGMDPAAIIEKTLGAMKNMGGLG
ncbi:MAG: hypothetical protein ACE5GE_16610 [Phycisphaerae bacterium]